MTFNSAFEFPRAGLTQDEKGEYKIGLSEMALLDAYQDRKQQQRELDSRSSFDRWMVDDE